MKHLIGRARISIVALSISAISATLCCPEMSPAAEAPRPLAPPTALSLREARVIIDGAVAYAREKKLRMTVVILDEEGQLISADRMEGASFHLERFAKGKAFTSLMLRDRTETAAELSKTRPDRYFGIIEHVPRRGLPRRRWRAARDRQSIGGCRRCCRVA
jgi:Haem degrading protein HbpS-like